MVHRCMSALQGGWLVANVEAIGLMDRDFHPDEYVQALPPALNCLPVHEIESLYCLPAVVSAAAAHLGTGFDETDYLKRLRDSVSDAEKHKVILERWKRRVEPQLVSVVASVQTRTDSLDTVVDALPAVFESASWGFSPTDLLQEEKTRVEAAVTDGPIEDLLRLLPGKGLLAVAAQFVGLQPEAYIGLVNGSLRAAPGLEALGANVEAALVNLLPPRATPDV